MIIWYQIQKVCLTQSLTNSIPALLQTWPLCQVWNQITCKNKCGRSKHNILQSIFQKKVTTVTQVAKFCKISSLIEQDVAASDILRYTDRLRSEIFPDSPTNRLTVVVVVVVVVVVIIVVVVVVVKKYSRFISSLKRFCDPSTAPCAVPHLMTADDAFAFLGLGLLAQEPALTCARPQCHSATVPRGTRLLCTCRLATHTRYPHRLLGTKEKKTQVLGKMPQSVQAGTSPLNRLQLEIHGKTKWSSWKTKGNCKNDCRWN